MAHFHYLPSEIMWKIFVKLSSKTLGRFLSVCKSWYVLISSKHFVSLHLIHNPNKENNLTNFFLQTYEHHKQRSLCEQFSLCQKNNSTLDSDIIYPPPAGKYNLGIYRVVGVSNGLICMFENITNEVDPFLWNPTIDMFLKLPNPTISHIDRPDAHAIGFWFDSKDSDFKLMRFVYRSNKQVIENFDLPPLAEVYSLNTREWTRINVDGVQCYMSGRSYCAVYVNGRSHWIGCRYGPYRCLIMSFDMHDGVFREIILPADLSSMRPSDVKVTERMGCLVVMGDLVKGCRFCRVWVMKEYGVFDSWTHLFDMPVNADGRYHMFLGFLKNGDVLMRKNFQQLALYSPETKSVVDIGQKFPSYACTYVESLALLDLKFSNEWMDEIEST